MSHSFFFVFFLGVFFFFFWIEVLIIVVGTYHCLSCGCFQWWGEEEEGEESIRRSFITRGRMQSLKKAKRLGVEIECAKICENYFIVMCIKEEGMRERNFRVQLVVWREWKCVGFKNKLMIKKKDATLKHVGIFTWLWCVCLQTCSECVCVCIECAMRAAKATVLTMLEP